MVTTCVMVHGADNFVGARLAARLAREEWATVIAVKAGDSDGLSKGLNDAQAIAHCIVGNAAQIGRCGRALYRPIAGSTNRPRVVHLSSMSVYGSAGGIIDESSELRADVGAYAAAHRDAEAIAAQAAQAVILRPGVEYGPECAAWSGRVAQWLRAHRLGDLGALGDGICNLVYIDDLISVLIAALRAPGIDRAVFNVAGGAGITWNDYFTAFALALGAVPVRRIGRRRLVLETRVAAPALRMAELLAGGLKMSFLRIPPPVPPSLLRVCRQEIVLSTALIDRTLRPQWTPLADGLRRAAEFYR
ncbi:MAG TPA: NAD-dependent epimerase/dehydratase family protein [Steroidobacteraceae bacterium]|nr:NAD-dependent epimerase/dehydratase family protein [Steroidobacteraceae bacterium]